MDLKTQITLPSWKNLELHNKNHLQVSLSTIHGLLKRNSQLNLYLKREEDGSQCLKY
ncbi:uncharacterized protein PGTG_14410 [Puccinia graminis f. sp. tritici CRL 75-36-700-3]|uniref:Uncharacterized protein n=1 Tax=Puccinia graminis f. sp. tritici (strain CRL 75-36-700-3 / race SCCL) TaxID=418459 RepID=E3KVI6_PUCGT|nr:uncharacterized protein PGTG_14410 [Puccinia graminis f. sp. tritici CRL 75-36-700-3]EFP88326.2 hypothetical protein PGTG_14410 [Puccinia graminis f. sp. tritici CRL 75-36-700-3]